MNFVILLTKFKEVKAISIKTFAHAGASARLHSDALVRLELLFGLEIEGLEEGFPCILFLLTGGSEAEAIKNLDPESFQILIADGKSNAFASAMEVKAYSRQIGCKNVLLSLDDENDKKQLALYCTVIYALAALKDKRLGLIGEVSDWLVASTIDEDVLKSKLGIDLVRIPWKDAGNYRDFEASEKFLSCYHAGRQYDVGEAGKVEGLLQQLIDDHKLDAITVECFSLVQENEVTACLGLSFLNDIDIPAGCEGDLCSIVGMMLVRSLGEDIPWMANIAGIKDSEVLLAHCTAPTNALSEHHINTHFETGKGTAINGRYKEGDVTILRLNNTLDKLFFSYGEVVDGMYEKHACRTQLHVKLPAEDIHTLKSDPLGNHHLVLPGDHTEMLRALAEVFRSLK